MSNINKQCCIALSKLFQCQMNTEQYKIPYFLFLFITVVSLCEMFPNLNQNQFKTASHTHLFIIDVDIFISHRHQIEGSIAKIKPSFNRVNYEQSQYYQCCNIFILFYFYLFYLSFNKQQVYGNKCLETI